jgi:hypothetical protein
MKQRQHSYVCSQLQFFALEEGHKQYVLEEIFLTTNSWP